MLFRSVAATPAAQAPAAQQTAAASGANSSKNIQLPGGTQRIPGVNPKSHHVRRQEALQHAQWVISMRQQWRAEAAAKAATAP